MIKIVFLLALFFNCNSFAQNQLHSDSVFNNLKVKRIVADSVEKCKPKIVVVGEKVQSDESYVEIAKTVLKKQFQDHPIISWFWIIIIAFWLLRTVDKLFRK